VYNAGVPLGFRPHYLAGLREHPREQRGGFCPVRRRINSGSVSLAHRRISPRLFCQPPAAL
jgi:hypothetical protein